MESSEHVAVGDSIQLRLLDGSTVAANSTRLPIGGSRALSYGTIVALGGDFYGTPDLSPISSSVDPQHAFGEAFQTLVKAPETELKAILGVLAKEQAAIASAVAQGQQPSAAYASLGDTLSYQWNEITGGGPASLKGPGLLNAGRYIQLATVNMDHFGADAITAYRAGHALARSAAAGLHDRDPSAADTRQELLTCYAMNAFADHFLTDLFAAGHVRTPRRALYEMSTTAAAESGLLTRAMHGEDNAAGLHFVNARGDAWLAYGDGKELDALNAANLAMAEAAVQTSANGVFQAAQTGQPNLSVLDATRFTPRPDLASKPQPGGPNHAPLFWADPKNYVYRRGGLAGSWHDKNNYDYTYYWSAAAMAAGLAACG